MIDNKLNILNFTVQVINVISSTPSLQESPCRQLFHTKDNRLNSNNFKFYFIIFEIEILSGARVSVVGDNQCLVIMNK